MVWHRDTVISKVIVSDSREHDKNTVATFTTKVFEVLRTMLPQVTAVNIWPDGPSSQFKNKFLFSFINKLQHRFTVSVTWNFFATSHGKGPNDALGGNVKRMAHRQAMSRHLVINGADSFAEVVRMSTNVIYVSVMTQTDIDSILNDMKLEEFWFSIPQMPGIFNIHCARVIGCQVHCKYYTDSHDNIRRVHNLPTEQSAMLKKVPGRHPVKTSRYECL